MKTSPKTTLINFIKFLITTLRLDNENNTYFRTSKFCIYMTSSAASAFPFFLFNGELDLFKGDDRLFVKWYNGINNDSIELSADPYFQENLIFDHDLQGHEDKIIYIMTECLNSLKKGG